MPYRLTVTYPIPGSDEFGFILRKVDENIKAIPIMPSEDEDKSVVLRRDGSVLFKIDLSLVALPTTLLDSVVAKFNNLPHADDLHLVIQFVKNLVKEFLTNLKKGKAKPEEPLEGLVRPEPARPEGVPQGGALLERKEGEPEAKGKERKEGEGEVFPERKEGALELSENTLIDEAILCSVGEINALCTRVKALLNKPTDFSDEFAIRGLIIRFNHHLMLNQEGLSQLHCEFILIKLHLKLFKLLLKKGDYRETFYTECLMGILKSLVKVLDLIEDNKKYHFLKPNLLDLNTRCYAELVNYRAELYLPLGLQTFSLCKGLGFLSPRVFSSSPVSIDFCNAWMFNRLCELKEKYGPHNKRKTMRDLFDSFAAIAHYFDEQLLKKPNYLSLLSKKELGITLSSIEQASLDSMKKSLEIEKFQAFLNNVLTLFDVKVRASRLSLEDYIIYLNSAIPSKHRLQRMLAIWLKDMWSAYRPIFPPTKSLECLKDLAVPDGEEYHFSSAPSLSDPQGRLPKVAR